MVFINHIVHSSKSPLILDSYALVSLYENEIHFDTIVNCIFSNSIRVLSILMGGINEKSDLILIMFGITTSRGK